MKVSERFELEEVTAISDRNVSGMHGRKKIPVSILGATGAVGQRMITLLSSHPWFEIRQLTASGKSVGKKYGEAVNWLLSDPIPDRISETIISDNEPNASLSLAFSALDSSVAEEIEKRYSDFGVPVVTNAKSNRMKQEIPLLIPEVNRDHLAILEKGKKGFIVANPNCAVIGLCIALKPLMDAFGIEKVHVTTYQSISGAGFPGVAALSITDNVIPCIPDEEEKVESEPIKIFSDLENGFYRAPQLKVSASCVRVPVTEGHLESVSLSFSRKPAHIEEIIEAWRKYQSPIDVLHLPSSPKKVLHYYAERNYPQPRLHKNIGQGMTVSVGAIRACSLFDAKFFLLSHNTIRGAAGGAVLIAELLVQEGYIFW